MPCGGCSKTTQLSTIGDKRTRLPQTKKNMSTQHPTTSNTLKVLLHDIFRNDIVRIKENIESLTTQKGKLLSELKDIYTLITGNPPQEVKTKYKTRLVLLLEKIPEDEVKNFKTLYLS